LQNTEGAALGLIKAMFGNKTGKKVGISVYVFRALIRWIKYIPRPTNALGSMDVILLHSGHQHVPRPSRWPLM
jgi:hypothetical protein